MRKTYISNLILALLSILALAPKLNADLLYSEGFESGSISGWTSSSNVSISQAVRHSGNYAVRAVHSGTVIFRRAFSQSTEFYAEWWWYTSAQWTGQNGVKFMRINYHQPYGVNVWWCDGSWATQMSTYDYSNTYAESSDRRAPYFSGIPPVKGGWIKIGVYARTNTGGAANGVFRIWMRNGDFNPNTDTPVYSSNRFIWNYQGSAVFNSIDMISNIESADSNCITYIDDIQIWNSMPGTSGGSTPTPTPTPTPSSSTVNQPSKLSMVSWTSNAQTGDPSWSDSTAVWCVRAPIDGTTIQVNGSNIVLGFQGRSSGSYTIRKVSIAEVDPNGQRGDVIDNTWRRVTFDNRTESTWGSDSITVPAGQVKRSNAIAYAFDRNKDYYVTFMIETPGVYLTAPSDYGQLYFDGVDHTDDVDWSGNGHSVYTGRLHGLSSVSVTQ